MPDYSWNYLATPGALFFKNLKKHESFSSIGDTITVYSFSSYRKDDFNFKSQIKLAGEGRTLDNFAVAHAALALIGAIGTTTLLF